MSGNCPANPQSFTTNKQRVDEIIRCGKDPSYFINRWAKIQHPVRGLIPFETFEFQDDCLRAFEEHRFNIILKSRQIGLSTVSAAYATWLASFYKDKTILIIATKLSVAVNFIKKVKVILKNLPPWLLLPKFEPTKQAVVFNNGSTITAIPTSEDAGRSEGLSLLIVDEAAWIKNFKEIWTGIYPTISTGGRAIVLSTPNGVGGQYHSLWVGAEAGVNGFNPIKLPWHVHPEHDIAWFQKETMGLPKRELGQEYECNFTSSGDTFLNPDDLYDLRLRIKAPIEKLGCDRNVWLWSYPIAGRQYVISADIARGDAHDFSAFHVIDTVDNEVAAEYMGKLPPEKLADLLIEWGKKYNNALLIPENNTFGYFVCTRIRDAGYRRLYYHKHRGDPFNYSPNDPTEIAGFPTNQKTREQILTKLEEVIRLKKLSVYSARLCDQLQTFIWINGRAAAGHGGFDDLVMSLAIGCWISHGATTSSAYDVEMSMAILASTTRTSRMFDEAMPRVNDARYSIAGTSNPYKPQEQKVPQTGTAEYAKFVRDTSWLI
jgi:hypothetical protein